MSWSLDPAFASTSHAVIDLKLCHVRLQNDQRYPWLMLIPRVPYAIELTDLDKRASRQMLAETQAASLAVRRLGEALDRPVEKLNIASLGNVTSQLHIHIVGRRSDDAVWPGPVWGQGTAAPYRNEDIPRLIETLNAWLA